MRDILNEINHFDINPIPFTPKGFEKYKEEVSKYVINLHEESLRVSKTNKSDKIQEIEVETASARFKNIRKEREMKLFDSIAGIFLGISFTSIFNIYLNGLQYNGGSLVIILILGILGGSWLLKGLFIN